MAKTQMKLKLISDTEYIINIPDDKLTITKGELAEILGYKESYLKNLPSSELPPPIKGGNKKSKRWLLTVVIDWAKNRSIYAK